MTGRDVTEGDIEGLEGDIETWGSVVHDAAARLSQSEPLREEESLVVSLRPSRFVD